MPEQLGAVGVPKGSQKPRILLASICFAGLLWASFYPCNIGFIAYFALIPWFELCRIDPKPRYFYRKVIFGHLLYGLICLQWMRLAHPMMYLTWIFLACYIAFYWTISLVLIRYLLRRGIALGLAAPMVIVSLDYFRAHFPTGFSWLEPLHLYHPIGFGWYFLGYSQHDYLVLIQSADIGGVYLISVMVIVMNVTIWEILHRCRWWQKSFKVETPTRTVAKVSLALGGSVFAANLIYGLVCLQHEPFAKGPVLAALQASLPQEIKMHKGTDLLRPYLLQWSRVLFGETGNETHKANRRKPDLIIWPETSCPDDWVSNLDRNKANGMIHPENSPLPGRLADGSGKKSDLEEGIIGQYRATQLLFGGGTAYAGVYPVLYQAFDRPILLGLNTYELENKIVWLYNSAVLYKNQRGYARYDKIHLVPFGEYVPLGELIPFLNNFTPYSHAYSCKRGEQFTRFSIDSQEGTFRFGVIICYEDSDPAIARNYVKNESDLGKVPEQAQNIAQQKPDQHKVDFLVNISNDGWFRGSEEHEEHFAICRFRAIETRRAIIRAVNMGISGIIDSDGDIVALPGKSLRASKSIEGYAAAPMPIDKRNSIYAQYGDWVPLSCWLGMLGLFVYLLGFKRKPKQL